MVTQAADRVVAISPDPLAAFGLEVLRQFALPFLSPEKELFIGFWVPAAALAYLAYRQDQAGKSNESFLKYLSSWSAFRSRSGRLDLRFFGFNALLYALLGGLILDLMPFSPLNSISEATTAAMNGLLSSLSGVLSVESFGSWILTGMIFLAADFAFYIVHYAFHRFPLLWEFHKVHHSATSLHPITAYRGHPVNTVATLLMTSVLVGVASGFVLFLSPDAQPIEVLGASGVSVVLLAAGAMFRHSSVWLHFGRLNGVFISPAHHQIHHSGETRHWNRNLGGSLSVWDRLFGTYYSPDVHEKFEYGLGKPVENERYASIRSLYFAPFLGIIRQRSS